MGCPPWARSVTCTYCKPPRAAGPPVATMDVPAAALLHFPSSADPEVLHEMPGLLGETGNSRAVESIPNLEETWDIAGRGDS